MGSENLFHKRKAPVASRRVKRDIKPRFLIVCEGTKTEPKFLQAFLDERRIPQTSIVIAKNKGTAPKSILSRARSLYEESKTADESEAFKAVFCVFDKDSHTSFSSTVNEIKQLNASGSPFFAIISTPCFEFWLLLHFEYSDAAIKATPTVSVGEQTVKMLRKIPAFVDYSKGQANAYEITKDMIDDAVRRAEKIRASAVSYSTNQFTANPWTNFDKLIRAISEWPKLEFLNHPTALACSRSA
jgi:RloB-like protein